MMQGLHMEELNVGVKDIVKDMLLLIWCIYTSLIIFSYSSRGLPLQPQKTKCC